ncbi:MAG TPA: purine-nucleoside phosphorylase [Ruminococcaceae bacterium]|jgi:purine nucleoside phosphorylase I, inosine and guanosine-specific|nr:purine-nucleoside phosphorylase [Oscillospiraceae bacterium]HCK49931.1 purine-nucleoside phosphorylase [Oscillospiraceae bacterium]
MNVNYEKLMKCFECVQQKITFKPEIALILGSGLGDYADTMEVVETLDYHDIEGFPVSTVPGHKGRFVFGYAGGVPIVAMQGRVHFYEGYKPQDVVLPIRLMKLMGAKVLFLTNAAGGINRSFNAGDFMLITDQISMSVPSPLIGENIDELGVRFPDMSEVYSRRLRKIIENSAVTAGVPLRKGVYIQTTGPQYETPAEIRAYERLGADAVGMSTAIEAIAARHAGMEICGISCISNLAAGISVNPLTHAEVQETADRVAPLFKKLVTQAIKDIHNA